MKIKDYRKVKIPSEFYHLTDDELEKEFARIMGDFCVKYRLSIDKQMGLVSTYLEQSILAMGMNDVEDIIFRMLIPNVVKRAIEKSKPSRKKDLDPKITYKRSKKLYH